MMRILVDTSFLVALINRRERHHDACVQVAAAQTEQLVVPVTVLPEAAYLLHSRMGHAVMRAFLVQMERPEWEIESLDATDLHRCGQLLEHYSDSAIDFVDSTLIAIAERQEIDTILTLDRRHFYTVRPRHVTHFHLLP